MAGKKEISVTLTSAQAKALINGIEADRALEILRDAL